MQEEAAVEGDEEIDQSPWVSVDCFILGTAPIRLIVVSWRNDQISVSFDSHVSGEAEKFIPMMDWTLRLRLSYPARRYLSQQTRRHSLSTETMIRDS